MVFYTFLDKNFNVYDPQDVHQNNMNPKIIAKYTSFTWR